ncbi:MAG: beta-L-arabinofuranosidase domain-containing protein [Sphaerochaetaceae bacterium]
MVYNTSFPTIQTSRIRLEGSSLRSFSCNGELGFRTNWIIDRLENQRPFSKEYIIGQISGEAGAWTNFPRVHGDIAGRWILAETVIHSNEDTPPENLTAIVNEVLSLQDDDGSFGCIHKIDQPLNMHRMYGNGWLLRALVQYAFTFGDREVVQAAIRLGDFYIAEFPLWIASDLGERETGFYAITRSCYFHAIDGLVALYRLTKMAKYLDLIGQFIPHLTPYETSDHSHMYLTIQRGLIEYYWEKGDREAIGAISDTLEEVYQQEIFENAGVPERFHLSGEENFTDEACSLFDWFFCCIRLYEIKGVTSWLDRAILTLENAIYFNQTYNGGFGSTTVEPHLFPTCKEAPWCCSLYGGWALSRIGGHLVSEEDGVLTINYPVGGTWNFTDSSFTIVVDEREGKLLVTSLGTHFKALRLYVPQWMDVEGASNTFITVEAENSSVELHFSYLPWLSRVGASPQPLSAQSKGEKQLLYGPYLMAHRGGEPVEIADCKGEVTWLKGFQYYPECFRYVVPAHISYSIYDVFLGVEEENNQLYFYPVKVKESPDGITTHVIMKKER